MIQEDIVEIATNNNADGMTIYFNSVDKILFDHSYNIFSIKEVLYKLYNQEIKYWDIENLYKAIEMCLKQ